MTLRVFLLFALALVLILVGVWEARVQREIRRNANIERAVRRALVTGNGREVQVWQQFLAHWPKAWQSVGFAWHSDTQTVEGDVGASAIVEDRYVIKVVFDFQASADVRDVQFTKLRFNFYEVKEVRPPPEGGSEGGFTISPNQEVNKWFGLAEWNQLVDSQWDFSKIGVNVVSNAPVQNIWKVLPVL